MAVLGIALAPLAGTVLQGSSACSQKTSPPPPPATVITIGVVESLTGDESATGQPLASATRVAEWQLNSIGGVLGHALAFNIADDATDPGTAVKVVNGFIALPVSGVLGPTASPEGVAVAPLLFDAKIVEISSTVTSPSLTTAQPQHDRYFFRTLPPNDVHGIVMANIAFRGPGVAPDAGPSRPDGGSSGCTHMALVHADDAFGNPFAAAAATKMKALGGAIVADVKFPSNVKADYKQEVGAVIAAQPLAECVGMIGFAPALAQFMKDYKNLTAGEPSRDWSKVFVIASQTGYGQAFITAGRTTPADPMSPTAVEGVYGVLVDPAPDTTEYHDFRDLYLAQFPLAPGQAAVPRNTANQYDAAILLALAIQQAGTWTDHAKIRDALFDVSRIGTAFGPGRLAEAIDAIKRGVDIDYNGASGNVDFDDFGNVSEDFILWHIENGADATVQHVKAVDTK
jgi:ABC-type branched-subunit amino acid transport system substrate-binding protein